MSCKICGRPSCATWMHSVEELEEFGSLDGMDEQRLRREEMSCKICGRPSCATWMHSVEELEEFGSLDGMDEQRLRREVVYLRREVAVLKLEILAALEKEEKQ